MGKPFAKGYLHSDNQSSARISRTVPVIQNRLNGLIRHFIPLLCKVEPSLFPIPQQYFGRQVSHHWRVITPSASV